jgi:hypothetical protein
VRIRGEIVVVAPIAVTWDALADLGSHVEWMADAESITFTSTRHSGVGTTFDCVTKVGPLHTVDKMAVTEWAEGTRIAVAHTGIVRGQGVFELVSCEVEATRVTWTEELQFPLYLGGVVGAFVAKPILRRIWKGNLSRFKALVEASYRKN